jgi:hypothetical protein
LPYLVLSRVFRGKFLDYLADAAGAGKLQFAGVTAPLATASGFDAFLRRQRGKEWVVYAKPPFGSPEQVLKYLARYTHRVAISDRRIVAIDDETVTFTYRDRENGDRRRTMKLDGVEFLRRFLLHVLPTGFVRIRYFGFLANRGRAANLARCRELIGASPTVATSPAPSAQPTPTAEEDDRHRCPSCGVGRLRCVAVLAPAAPTLNDTS